MAKANWNEYSATAGSNTVIDDINIAEGCPPSTINNALREMMAHTADVVAGPVALSPINIDGGSITGITDLAVADGGTGSSTASGARTNLGLGTSATIDVGTTANKIVQLDGSAELPAVSAANLTNLPPDLSGDLRNIALGSAADRITLLNQIVDPLTDESDVNTSSSTNDTFTASGGGFYNASTVATLVAGGTGSAVGDMTASGGLSSAFDGTTSQAHASSAKGANDTGTSFIGKDWGSGVSKTVTKYELFAPSDSGFDGDSGGSTITIKLVGSNSTPSIGSGTQLHTDSFSDSTGLTKTYTSGITTTTAYRYVWVEISTNTTNVGQKHGRLAEVKFYIDGPQNLTLISNAYTATSAPSKTILGFQAVENEAVTINTDLKGFVSRDGGSNFTEVTLALKTTLGQTGTKYYECAETTISSTSGSSMVWKITTHNTKDIEIHGVALSWS